MSSGENFVKSISGSCSLGFLSEVFVMTDFPDDMKPLYCNIGFVALQWAYVEQNIDMIVAIIYHFFNGKLLADKQEIPRSLTKKIPFINKCLKAIPDLAPFQAEGKALMTRANQFSKKRHDMIHSVLVKWNPNPESFDFAKFDYEKEIHRLREINFTANDYRQFGNNMTGLITELGQFCKRLLPGLGS